MSPYAKAAVGAALIGAGLAFMSAAMNDVRAARETCVDCDDKTPEETAAAVAAASAEVNGNGTPLPRAPRVVKTATEETTTVDDG